MLSEPSAPPSLRSCPPRAWVERGAAFGDLADEVRAFAAVAGYRMLDWQVEVVRAWSSYRAGGGWVHRRCGASIPRQAGKSVDGIIWAAFLVAMLGYNVLWTDHNYSTTCEMLRRFQKIFGERAGDPRSVGALNRLVAKTVSKTAQEMFQFKNGGVLAFSTRTKSAALGYSFDVVILDEAQELAAEHLQAINPTTTSGPHHNMQLVYLGTPTRAGSAAREFSALRAEALGDDPGDDVFWCEWGVGEVGDVLDESRWESANPSLGPGMADVEAIRAGIRSMAKTNPVGAAQEYLGYWLPATSADAAVSPDDWAACGVDGFPAPDPRLEKVAYGVKFSPDGERVAMAACIERRGRVPHIELVLDETVRAGIPAVAQAIGRGARTVAEVLMDGRAGVSDLRAEVPRAVPRAMLREASPRDAADAAALFVNLVERHAVTHFAGPGQARLDESVSAATKRKIGRDGYGLDGPGHHAAEAAALALLAVKTTKRDPARRLRVG